MTTAEDIYYDLLPEEAMDQLQALASKGDHEAELYLGHLMDESSPRDPFGALFWYKKAAEGGLLEAKHSPQLENLPTEVSLRYGDFAGNDSRIQATGGHALLRLI